MPVWKAVVASMAVPILFRPVDYDGHLYVDGGVFENVPLCPFGASAQVLTFRFAGGVPAQSSGELHASGFPAYVRRLMQCAVSFHERSQLRQSVPVQVRHRVIEVDSGSMQSLQFRITREEKMDCL